MKHPVKSDFDTAVTGVGVDVTFKPTSGIYSFYRLANTNEVAALGSVSYADVQHEGINIEDYSPDEVQDMAKRIASEVAASLSLVQDEEETNRLTTVRPAPGDRGD